MKQVIKFLNSLLAIMLVITLLAGCSSNADQSMSTANTASDKQSGDQIGDETTEQDSDQTSDQNKDSSQEQAVEKESFDYDAASKYLDSDEVVLTINGQDILWNEYYYWLKTSVSSLESGMGIDWESIIQYVGLGEGDMTQSEYVKAYSEYIITYYRAVEAYVKEAGYEVSDEEVQSQIDALMSGYDSEEEMAASLNTQYLPVEILAYYNTVNRMYNEALIGLYGENGENVSDEELTAFAEDNKYYQIKQIYLSTLDEDGLMLDEEGSAEKLRQAQGIVEDLEAYLGNEEELLNKFQEYVDDSSDDPYKESYPDGYLFASGYMSSTIEDAAAQLENYQVSQPLKSTDGYYIIIRLPINFDMAPYKSGNHSLRYYAAKSLVDNAIEEKLQSAEVVYSEAGSALIYKEVFQYN